MPDQHGIAIWGLAVAAVVVLALWLPFGFAAGGLIEEWGILSLYSQQGVIYVADAGNALAAHRLRPLTVLPHAIAYALDPTSFRYWHVLALAMLGLKVVAGVSLGGWLFRSRRWAVLFALLLLVYPADTMQHSFRALHINASVALVLSGAALVLHALDRSTRWHAWLLGLLGAACFAVAVLMYEAALLMGVLPFAWMMARDGLRAPFVAIRTRAAPLVLWCLAGLACGAYIFSVVRSGGTYQSAVVGEAGMGGVLLHNSPKLFTVAFNRTFLGGWVDAIGVFLYEVRNYVYTLLVSTALVGLVHLAGRAGERRGGEARMPRILVLVAIGLVLVALGYLPFLMSPAHIQITQRTYLFVAPGAALVVCSLLIGLSRFARPIADIAAAVLVLLGFTSQLYQLDHYARIAESQRRVLTEVIARAGDPGGRQLVVLDASQRLNHTWMLGGGYLTAATSFLLDRPLAPAQVCLMPTGEWQVRDGWGRTGHCGFSEGRWHFTAPPPATASGSPVPAPITPVDLAPESVDVVRLDEVDRPEATARDRAVLAARNDGSRAAQRIHNILLRPDWPLDFRLFERPGGAAYRWDFGRWWSMETPPEGSGWREAEWDLQRFRQRSAAWKVADRSTLRFPLTPVDRPYELQGRIVAFASDETRQKLGVSVNGRAVQVRLGDSGGLYAVVPPGVLHQGMNEIEFDGPLAERAYGLGFALDWVSVEPAAR